MVDPKKKADTDEIELGSRSGVLFENKECDKELSIDDIYKFTNNFSQANIINCGGFGLAYKATLPHGTEVASIFDELVTKLLCNSCKFVMI